MWKEKNLKEKTLNLKFFTTFDEECVAACQMGANDPMADPIQPDEAIALGLVSTETPPADAHQRPSVEECENKCKQYWILTEPGKKREKTPKLGPKVNS